jgi:hypothetical protein
MLMPWSMLAIEVEGKLPVADSDELLRKGTLKLACLGPPLEAQLRPDDLRDDSELPGHSKEL